jgi:hypothetical protein
MSRLAGIVATAAAALLGALAMAPGAGAAAGTAFTVTLNSPSMPCYVNFCTARATYDTAQMTGPGEVAVDWDHDPAAGFVPKATQRCAPGFTCVLYSPTFAALGTRTVMLRVTEDADGVAAFGTQTLDVVAVPTPPAPPPAYVPPATTQPIYDDDPDPVTTPQRTPRPTRKPTRTPTRTPSTEDAEAAFELCRDTPPGVRCQAGNGRQTAGGGEKVSHKGWPKITGVFWQVMNNAGRKKTGGAANDELLGHHGSDVLDGRAGHDVLWGDWDPKNNNTRQRDVLRGGAGNDFIYPSHGTTTVLAGPGKDYIWAFYGKGVIDCGPGYDTVRVRLNGAFKLKHCEVVGHFCQFGADGHGGCLKPGEKRSATARRRSA